MIHRKIYEFVSADELNEHHETMKSLAQSIRFNQAEIERLESKLKILKNGKQEIQTTLFAANENLNKEQIESRISSLKDGINALDSGIKEQERILLVKMRFYYQNEGGTSLPQDSPQRNPERFSPGRYALLKENNFYPPERSYKITDEAEINYRLQLRQNYG